MNRYALSVVLAILLLGGSFPPGRSRAQNTSPQPDRSLIADTLSGKAAIRALEAQMQEGVLHRDLRTLRRLWAKGFMVNAPRNVVVPNRAAVMAVFRKGIPNYSTFDPQIEKIRLWDDMAVVMGRETVKPVGDAPHAGATVRRRYTHVWRKQKGQWRLFVRHAHIVSIE